MLAEGGEHVGGAAGDEETRRLHIDEAYCVADDIGEEARAGGHRHGIVDVRLDGRRPMARRTGGAQFVHRHELEEEAVVEAELQALARTAVGGGDEALRSRIDLAHVDVLTREQRLEAGAIGREIDAAMDEEAQIRERGACGLAARVAQRTHALKEDQHPGRRAGEDADVLVERRLGDAGELFIPVGEKGDLRRREGIGLRPARQRRGGDGGEIAGEDAGRFLDQRRRAAEHQRSAAEEAARWPGGGVEGEDVERRAHVRAPHLRGERQVFAAARSRAGRDGEIGNAPRPGDVVEDREGGLPVAVPHLFVAAQRYARLEVGDRADGGEVVILAEGGAARGAHQLRQFARLRRRRVERRETPPPPRRIEP